MNILECDFVKKFIQITYDAYLKGWHERNGGNLSYRIEQKEIDLIREFLCETNPFHEIGIKVEELAGEYFLVTGSGKFFRNIIINPKDNIAIIKIDETGTKYSIVWGLTSGGIPTSELPSHLMCHQKKLKKEHRVILHSHPTNVIALTFVLPQDDKTFTHELWEMATECPVVFPDGIGVIPWMVPGGKEIAELTSKAMEYYDSVIWAHHGMFCSGKNLDITFGLMDTIEKSAEILVKVISMGGKKQTITNENLKALAKDFKVILSEKFMIGDVKNE